MKTALSGLSQEMLNVMDTFDDVFDISWLFSLTIHANIGLYFDVSVCDC